MELVTDHISNFIALPPTGLHHPIVMAECVGELQCSGTGGSEGDGSVAIIEAYRSFLSFLDFLGMLVSFAIIVAAGIGLVVVTFYYYLIVFWLVLFSFMVTVIPPSMLTD